LGEGELFEFWAPFHANLERCRFFDIVFDYIELLRVLTSSIDGEFPTHNGYSNIRTLIVLCTDMS
jgi:hypothetical protein